MFRDLLFDPEKQAIVTTAGVVVVCGIPTVEASFPLLNLYGELEKKLSFQVRHQSLKETLNPETIAKVRELLEQMKLWSETMTPETTTKVRELLEQIKGL